MMQLCRSHRIPLEGYAPQAGQLNRRLLHMYVLPTGASDQSALIHPPSQLRAAVRGALVDSRPPWAGPITRIVSSPLALIE